LMNLHCKPRDGPRQTPTRGVLCLIATSIDRAGPAGGGSSAAGAARDVVRSSMCGPQQLRSWCYIHQMRPPGLTRREGVAPRHRGGKLRPRPCGGFAPPRLTPKKTGLPQNITAEKLWRSDRWGRSGPRNLKSQTPRRPLWRQVLTSKRPPRPSAVDSAVGPGCVKTLRGIMAPRILRLVVTLRAKRRLGRIGHQSRRRGRGGLGAGARNRLRHGPVKDCHF
jgi:hypothetical protein